VQVISPYRANGIPPLEVVVADLAKGKIVLLIIMLPVVFLKNLVSFAKVFYGKTQ